MSFFRKIFPSKNDKLVKQIQKITVQVNALEDSLKSLKDADFPERTRLLQKKVADGATRFDVLAEGFALIREAALRTLNMRHFDVQIMGGVALLAGKVAEMSTGEGKTLVATLPAYVVALEGKGAHIITVNDYLAKRDAQWMGRVLEFLGLSVGFIQGGMSSEERKQNYTCDVTYVTNNELGFDYLRDNMRGYKEASVLRDLHFAIVDEVDSILIDEARTPLIISGPSDNKENLCDLANKIVKGLASGDFELDEKNKGISLTEQGMSKVESLLKKGGFLEESSSLYDIENSAVVHFIIQSLKAWKIFQRNKDYIVKNNKVYIIDEFTGRIMEGRRFSDNLHQAIESKEGVPILRENQTLASVTYQNLFRMYATLSGMSGTVMTESVEFSEIYKLSCISLPTNKPLLRKDRQDLLYATLEEKTQAILKKVAQCHAKKQPVLIGTVSIEKSEFFSRALKKEKIPHNILNAKNHRKEAAIIASAGDPGAVTIATNMAGRGTDIKLGGHVDFHLDGLDKNVSEEKKKEIIQKFERHKQEVLEAGGLCIIGTERHESRRIDNQLRGRSGRQGDPGESVFFLCLEDDLMRVFAGDKVQFLLNRMKNQQKGEPIEHKLISRAIEKAQSRVEAQNYEVRKHLLNFDDVSNNQREMVYAMRREIIEQQKTTENLLTTYVEECVDGLVNDTFPDENLDGEKIGSFINRLSKTFQDVSFEGVKEVTSVSDLKVTLRGVLDQRLLQDCSSLDEEQTTFLLHFVLHCIDVNWRHHLARIDSLKQGINLRSYAQGSPLVEFKKESFDLFVKFLAFNALEIIAILVNNLDKMLSQNFGSSSDTMPVKAPSSRNHPCPCGSGKKFKHCHGNLIKKA